MALIADVVRTICGSQPAPVLCLDTCTLLDIVRAIPRNRDSEIQAAKQLLTKLAFDSHSLHLIVAELVPREFQDNLNKESKQLETELNRIEKSNETVANVIAATDLPKISTLNYPKKSLIDEVCSLAEKVLSAALQLDRDFPCLERALGRVITKVRPSHNNEIKDSLMFEQYLELARQLRASGFTQDCVFISSDKDAFCKPETPHIHPDLEQEIQTVPMKYFPSLSAALGSLGIWKA